MKVAVLVSGGVDSSVALSLLKEQGYEVEAFYLKIWLEDELEFLGECPWEEDLQYVRAICEQLDVPLRIIPLQQEYWKRVVEEMISEIKKGRTPNPDILCNSRIKFNAFLEKISGFEKVASGHYARIIEKEDKYYLGKGKDEKKDQSYFLSHLSHDQISRIWFPIGELTKQEVREHAQQLGFDNANRKDSQGICFLGKISYKEFVKHYMGTEQGPIINYETGEQIGTHEGAWFYTVGQRKGIGLAYGPWYVVKKDKEKNIVYVSNTFEEHNKDRRECYVEDIHWITEKPKDFSQLTFRIRHGDVCYHGQFTMKTDKEGYLVLDTLDQGLATGQYVCFYEGDICHGCGIVRSIL